MGYSVISGGAVTGNTFRHDVDGGFYLNSPTINIGGSLLAGYTTIDGEYLIGGSSVYILDADGSYKYHDTIYNMIPGLLYNTGALQVANHNHDGTLIAMSISGRATFSHEIYLVEYNKTTKTFSVLDSIDSVYNGYGFYQASINREGTKLVYNRYITSSNQFTQVDISSGTFSSNYDNINLGTGSYKIQWVNETSLVFMAPSAAIYLASLAPTPNQVAKVSSQLNLNQNPSKLSGIVIDRGSDEYIAMNTGYNHSSTRRHFALSFVKLSGIKYVVITGNRFVLPSNLGNNYAGWTSHLTEIWGCVIGIPVLSETVSTDAQVVFGTPVVLWEGGSSCGSFEATENDNNGTLSALGYFSDGLNNNTASIILNPSYIPKGNLFGISNGYNASKVVYMSNGSMERRAIFTDAHYSFTRDARRRSYVNLLRPKLAPPT